MMDYQWQLPRFDLITLDREGAIRRVKGLSHPWRPAVPATPQGQLALATIEQTWQVEQPWQGVRTINTAIQAIPMADIEAMRTAIHSLYDLVAQERLRNDANAQDPAAKRGVFVDPFFDDDLRDQGLPQTAAIVDGQLCLPITGAIVDLARTTEPLMLEYELEPVIEQLLRTTDMKINPYQAFDPIPASVTLNLAIDRWTEMQTQWASPITQRFSRFTSPLTSNRFVGSGNAARFSSRATENVLLRIESAASNELLSSRSQAAVFMRQVSQEFTLEGFDPDEALTLLFDGIKLVPSEVEAKEV